MDPTHSLSVYVLSQNSEEAKSITSQVPTMVALTKGCKSATVVTSSDGIPEGCGSTVLSSTLSVYILVKVSDTGASVETKHLAMP